MREKIKIRSGIRSYDERETLIKEMKTGESK